MSKVYVIVELYPYNQQGDKNYYSYAEVIINSIVVVLEIIIHHKH